MNFINISILIFTFILIIFSLRFSWWRRNIQFSYPRILMYHMIREHLPKNKSKFNRLRVKPNEFEKQLIWLKKNNFTSYTLSELIKLKEIPSKAVVITFDDGYEDNFTNAFPLLKKYNFKATIYVVIDRFDKNWAIDKDLNILCDELNNEPMLSDEQIKVMIQSGLIEIGSHTLDHVNLPELSFEEKTIEIKKSKEKLEKIFDIKCTSFAYPFGFFDSDSIKIVEESNYANATTTVNDIYNTSKYSKFEIPRIMISGRQRLFSFILKIKKGRNR